MMGEIAQGIWAGLAGASLLDRVNLALGIAGVVLMVRRSLWAFPVGLVAVTVQGVLFFGAKFYADAALQIFFFGALAWGWPPAPAPNLAHLSLWPSKKLSSKKWLFKR